MGKNSKFIVPGDILEITSNSIVPCDALLIEGFCTVNESDISGENNLIMKYHLPKSNNIFKYSSNQKSILYNGSQVNKCESKNSAGKVYAIVLNTGLSTNRGNLIQNILFPKPTNFRLFNEIKEIFIGMLVFYIFYCVVYINLMFSTTNPDSPIVIFTKLLTDFVNLFSPNILINVVFTTFYFQYKLGNSDISCTSELRINAAGKVNYLVLDKTGTLTEEGLDLYGFQITKVNCEESNPKHVESFDNIEHSLDLYNDIYINFWTRLINLTVDNDLQNNYKTNYQSNIIYYIECLATCHSIDKIRGEVLGNSIDKSIFDKLMWKQEVSSVLDNDDDEKVIAILII